VRASPWIYRNIRPGRARSARESPGHSRVIPPFRQRFEKFLAEKLKYLAWKKYFLGEKNKNLAEKSGMLRLYSAGSLALHANQRRRGAQIRRIFGNFPR
jgi:hypothetical protein